MLETDRLLLRRLRRDDMIMLLALFADPEVMKYSDTGLREEEQVAVWLQRQLKTSQIPPLGYRAIELKATGQGIGYVSVLDAASRSQTGDVELGIRLVSDAWRQGYAIEAARRMVDLAFEHASAMRVIGIVDPENVRSVQLLRKLDMRFERKIEFEGYDHPDHLYVLDRRLPTPRPR